MVSDTDAPNSNDFFEFLTTQGPMGFFWNAGPPFSKYSMHLAALFSSELRSLSLFSSTSSLNLEVFIFVSGFDGMPLCGNCLQNSCEPLPPYFSSLGISGFFGGFSSLAFSCGIAADDVANSQNIMMDHFEGRPRSALEAGEGSPMLVVQPLWLCTCIYSWNILSGTVNVYVISQAGSTTFRVCMREEIINNLLYWLLPYDLLFTF